MANGKSKTIKVALLQICSLIILCFTSKFWWFTFSIASPSQLMIKSFIPSSSPQILHSYHLNVSSSLCPPTARCHFTQFIRFILLALRGFSKDPQLEIRCLTPGLSHPYRAYKNTTTNT